MTLDKPSRNHYSSRRSLLRAVGTLPIAMAALPQRTGAAEGEKIPQIRIGKYLISRLICGVNPFMGISHMSGMLDQDFRQYYTREQVLETLRHCQKVGINTWQGGANSTPRFFDKDSGIQCIVNDSGDFARIQQWAKMGCMAIGHHGGATDKLFRLGQLEQVREYCKRVRDAGLLVGLVSHMPDVFDAVESQGWDVDYYMTSVYPFGRTRAELEKLLPKGLLPVEAKTLDSPEVYLESDPPRMYRVIRQTKKPCLAFKILAAGRRCQSPEHVAEAFREAFQNINPTDAVVVGIYDRHNDLAAQNAEYVRRFSSLSSA